MCSKMIVVALVLCLTQALAFPGMGMMGGMMGGPMMMGGGMGMMGGGMGMMGGPMMMGGKGGAGLEAVKTLATFNKQLGMSQALLGKNVKTAQAEVKLQVDALKAATKTIPAGDPCGDIAKAAITAIDTELLTAFDRCQMKDEVQSLRFQSLSLKTQMTALKMAKKACKLELDPATCLADATTNANDNVTQLGGDVNTGMTDVITKSNECVTEVKDDLLEKVEDAADDLILC